MKFLSYSAGFLSVAALLTACQSGSTSVQSARVSKNLVTSGSPIPPIPVQHLPGHTADSDISKLSDADFIASLKLKTVKWDTGGGGDLHYSITRSSVTAKDFVINLTSRSFRTYNESYLIPCDGSVLYKKLLALFRGRIKMSEVTPTGMTGTYSSVKLDQLDGTETVLNSPKIENRGAETLFEDLREFIEGVISSNITTCESLPALDGTWKTSYGDVNDLSTSHTTFTQTSKTDNTIDYSSVTVIDAHGKDPASTTAASTLTYHMDQCRIVTQAGSEVPAWKIVYISSMPGFLKIKSRMCTDVDCTGLTDTGTQELYKEIP